MTAEPRLTLMPGIDAGNSITLIDFADSFAAKVNSLDMPHIKSVNTVFHYLGEMRTAAEHGDADFVARLARCVSTIVREERARVAG